MCYKLKKALQSQYKFFERQPWKPVVMALPNSDIQWLFRKRLEDVVDAAQVAHRISGKRDETSTRLNKAIAMRDKHAYSLEEQRAFIIGQGRQKYKADLGPVNVGLLLCMNVLPYILVTRILLHLSFPSLSPSSLQAPPQYDREEMNHFPSYSSGNLTAQQLWAPKLGTAPESKKFTHHQTLGPRVR